MNRKLVQTNLSTIIQTFLQFQTDVKMYHWQTYSFSRHKSSDNLHQNIIDLIDEFVETYMGQNHIHAKIYSPRDMIKLRNISDKQMVAIVKKFKTYLQNMEKAYPYIGTDLLNLRDEILSLADKTLYLFTLN